MVHVTIRHAELARVRRLLERHSAAAVISRPGLGGDEMLAALEEESGAPVIRVPSSQAEAERAYSGLDILLASLRTLDLPGFDSLKCHDALMRGDADGTSTAMEIAEEITRLIRGVEPGRDARVIIPEADGMDTPSQLILGHVLRRIAGTRLTFVISARSLPAPSPLAGVPGVELSPLGDDRMRELAHELTAGRIAPEVAEAAVRTASGRCSALGQLLERLPSNQLEGGQALGLPFRLGTAAEEMAAEAVDGIDGEAVDLLGLMSLAPLSPRASVLADSRDCRELIAELEARGTVEQDGVYIRFSEELVRAGSHQALSVSRRMAGHELLAQRCADTYPLLHRWHRSFVDGEDDLAERLLADAGELVRSGFDWAGIEFAERALVLSLDPGRLAAELNDLAACLIDRGRIGFALRYLHQASRTADPGLLVRARTLRVWAEFLTDQTVPVRSRSHWSRGEVAVAPAEVAHLQLVMSLCHALRRESAEAQELLERAHELAQHFDDRSQRLWRAVSVLLDCGRGRAARALEDLRRLDAIEAEDPDPICLLLLSMGLMLTEHYDPALAVLDCLEARRGQGSIWETQAAMVRSEIAIRRGDIRQAIILVDRCSSPGLPGESIRRDRRLLLQCWSLLAQGRASDAERVEAAVTALAMDSQHRSLLAELNAVQGNHLLRMGLPAEAVRHLHRCEELSSGEINPNIFRYEPDLVEALVDAGRREHAEMLVRVLHGRVERVHSRWAELALERSRALLLPEHKCFEAMGRLLGSWQPTDAQFDRGVALLVMSKRLTAAGAHRLAAERSRLAEAAFREVGAEHLARTARPVVAEVDRPPEPSGLLGRLSEDELAVVELVREGLKNREIAARVFVSLRTVELRLTAVYRKLEVTSRTELIARLAHEPGLRVA